jgi:hypothetical protein
MHDELAELTAVWQRDSGDADALIAAVRREHARQRWILAAEIAVCVVAIAAGIWLSLYPGASRIIGLLAIAYALGGVAITWWGRVALVRQLAQPVAIVTDGGLSQRLGLSAWLMSGLGIAFLAAELIATGSTPAVLLSNPLKLWSTIYAIALIAGVLLWQWRSGRRRAAELERLLSRDDSGPEYIPPRK